MVYQNSNRYLACQFTFTCEGKSLRITEPASWRDAVRIAREVYDGTTYLPEVGASFNQGDVAGVVESVKAAADVFMPVTGEIVEVNEALRNDPSLANSDPLNSGWFFKVKLSDVSQLDALLDETAYNDFAANA